MPVGDKTRHDPDTSVLHLVVGSYNGLQLGERIRLRVYLVIMLD